MYLWRNPTTTSYRSFLLVLDERDELTGHHSARVAGLSLELGRACGLDERELGLLEKAAALHDIGKIGIPDTVLLKLGRYTEEDWAIMKAHPVKSQRIIRAVDMLGGEEIGRIVRHHHERFDGRGYPDGLAGEDIPVMSRIIALADTYDAMARTRVYRLAQPHAKILEELEKVAGLQHDPYLSKKFVKLIEHSEFKATASDALADVRGTVPLDSAVLLH
jgi:HD-GYP domain-containing protein (c-di-GMP phosphodiesterase class II)